MAIAKRFTYLDDTNSVQRETSGVNRGNLVTPVMVDRCVALLAIIVLQPLWLINISAALFSTRPVYRRVTIYDALQRPVHAAVFTSGFFVHSLYLLSIFSGKLAFVGVSIQHQLLTRKPANIRLSSGCVSLYDLHKKVGLCERGHSELLQEQQINDGILFRYKLLIRFVIAQVFYGRCSDFAPATIRLFGITIHNKRMNEAINWVCAERGSRPTEIGYFVNVNSFNIAKGNNVFSDTLSKADQLFADGSGVRIAAAQAGYRLRDNVNGTDMLPLLCARFVKMGKSLYLLGAAPGVAEKTANNLRKQFPGLNIVGVQHGFFNKQQLNEVLDHINQSHCSALLVAMGSPVQEQWLADHRDQLRIPCALAVGGLFDFYAGNIERAPCWLRELGFEWIWRLMQEPSRMWRRYILGNPAFLFRTFFCRKELLK